MNTVTSARIETISVAYATVGRLKLFEGPRRRPLILQAG
jgi:hypothetical protein